MTTIADYLAERLWSQGLRRVYGLPGGENVVLLEALRRRGIVFRLVRNESSACFMAATEARLSGGLGVALTTLGPGASNACAGLAHAHLDRAPILLITAASDRADLRRHTHQVIDLQSLFAPISKLSAEISQANATDLIDRAIKLTRQGRPGPAHLSLHNGVASQPISAIPSAREPIASALPESGHIGEAIRLLEGMRKPLIIAGLGMEPDAPYRQIRQLAERLGAPLIDTPKSKGALSADHPLHAGTIGLTRHDPVYALLEDADGIIAIGFDVVELVKPWDYDKPLIWIANWANRDPHIAAALELVGDMTAILSALDGRQSASEASWGTRRVGHLRESQASLVPPSPGKGRILPGTFLESLRLHTPDDIIITTDVGSHKIFAALNWRARLPNRYFVSNGLSAMGFGLSSAIAAAELTGEPVVCITGDAGLAMVMGELSLLVELGLPVLVCVMNDAALDLIRSAQLRHGAPAYGTEFSNPDYASIAAAYGLVYYRVESPADCDRAINRALDGRMPALVDVMIDPIGYPTTPGSQRANALSQ